MPKGTLLVLGNLNVDRILSVKRLPDPGTSVEVIAERIRFGGCGGNIAIAASRLGVQTRLSSVVGEDLPLKYRERLDRSGVDLSELTISQNNATPFCIILTDPDGRQMYAFHMGAMSEQARSAMPDPDGLVYCHAATSDPIYCTKVFSRMREEGIETGLDPGQEISFRWDRRSLSDVLEDTTRFFGNWLEWRRLGEYMGWVGDFPEAFDIIDEAIVTLGGNGAMLVDRDGPRQVPPFELGAMVDPTGAGDAFRGAFYAAKSRGFSSIDAVRFGNIMGGFAITHDGAQEYDLDWDGLLDMERIEPAQLAHQSS